MSKYIRKNIKVFGSNSSNTGKFGSAAAGSGVLTTDIETMQSLSAWDNGMASATLGGNKLLPQEEMESALRVTTYGLANIYQDGAPVYDALTTYYTSSVVRKDGTYELYGSNTDSNIGNPLSDTVNWKYLGKLSDIVNLSNINEPGYIPYSVNYSYTINGVGAFANYVSASSVSFLVDNGTVYKPLLITLPNGKTYCITSIATLTGLSLATVNYDYMLKETDLTATGASLTIGGTVYPTYTAVATAVNNTTYGETTEDIIAPASPVSGTYWLDVSTKPLIPKIYNGSTWVETQFVKLATSVAAETAVRTCALKGSFTSPLTAFSTTVPSVIAHNLGINGKQLKSEIRFICTVASNGYIVGEPAQGVIVVYGDGASSWSTPATPTHNKNTIWIGLAVGSYGALTSRDKITGTHFIVSPSNWSIIATADRRF